jgi:acyl-coenzyme A synthetase/AMP-(fatty) acid ligase
MPHARTRRGRLRVRDTADGQSIDRHPASQLSWRRQGSRDQKFPEHVELVEELPRTASGKVQKNVLRERIGTQRLGER